MRLGSFFRRGVLGRMSRPQLIGSSVLLAGVLLAVVSGLVVELVQRAPGPIRGLPGVSALVPVNPPVYERSVFALSSPLSIDVSSDGRYLYVVEGTGDRVVRRIDLRTGEPAGELAPPQTEPGTRKPLSVAVAPNDTVYVVDRVRRTVDVFAPSGDWLGQLPSPGSDDAWSPLSVDVDKAGRAYVTNTQAGSPVLVVYDDERRVESKFDSIQAAGVPVSFPNGVALASDGELIISDSNNARLVLLDPRTGGTRVFGTEPTTALALPRGLAIDRRGFCLVADANDHTLVGFDFSRKPAQARLFAAGTAGVGDGAFQFPNDVAVASDGRIYIADRDNDRVQVWRY